MLCIRVYHAESFRITFENEGGLLRIRLWHIGSVGVGVFGTRSRVVDVVFRLDALGTLSCTKRLFDDDLYAIELFGFIAEMPEEVCADGVWCIGEVGERIGNVLELFSDGICLMVVVRSIPLQVFFDNVRIGVKLGVSDTSDGRARVEGEQFVVISRKNDSMLR